VRRLSLIAYPTHKGDPLSLMPNILAIDHMQIILQCTCQTRMILPMDTRATSFVISLYADDVEILANLWRCN
jgi:hypothetical protein